MAPLTHAWPSYQVRGFTVIVLVLWNYTVPAWVHLGVTAETDGDVTQKLDVLWACTATFAGAVLMVLIEAFEQARYITVTLPLPYRYITVTLPFSSKPSSRRCATRPRR